MTMEGFGFIPKPEKPSFTLTLAQKAFEAALAAGFSANQAQIIFGMRERGDEEGINILKLAFEDIDSAKRRLEAVGIGTFGSKFMPTQTRFKTIADEIGMTPKFQRAKELGIDVSQYVPSSAQSGYNFEIGMLSANLALGRAIRQEEERGQLLRVELFAKEYPQRFKRFKTTLPIAPEGRTEQAFRSEFFQFGLKDPEFKQLRLERETEMRKEWPDLFPAYLRAPIGERVKAGGFMPWVQSKPEMRAFFEESQALKTRPRRTRPVQFARI